MKAPSTILAAASLMATVHAHGYISQPKATYDSTTEYTKYNALTSASVNKGFSGGKYDDSPENNAKAFNDHWNATGYKSLREMLDPIAPDYGHSLKTATPVDVTGYTEMWWQNDEYKEGFINSHSGPCEAWIDDVKIFHHDNCAAEFKSYPAKVPADYSSCKGDCLLVFYWLALHEPNWQIYKQCVPITNGGSSTTQSSGKGETDASDAGTTEQTTLVATPAATTTAPKAAVVTPSPVESTPEPVEATPEPVTATLKPFEEATETPSTEAPEVATPAPEAATEAPEDATEAPEAATEAPAAKTGLRKDCHA
ncbi:hypothetical protein PHYSODRAFT_329293 [Phytophthora sojae]|uniref:Uncharacterized protein n=1 Tax=Phytophthora sojae (strain P6497) TaxID=1094619 RepID=G4ZBV9_PHYSP|nr:hypothetical protein PHYSODRAFT_329293 [Phytophthora sojae]EGZ21313.1 hypothetical protein PHYSODRAFT_329293 [Phytophthora sojae]|eukprot:XP_009524030.1 hypothetical protein PHYSODRAFT_329293 [Phytophthora sojae]